MIVILILYPDSNPDHDQNQLDCVLARDTHVEKKYTNPFIIFFKRHNPAKIIKQIIFWHLNTLNEMKWIGL